MSIYLTPQTARRHRPSSCLFTLCLFFFTLIFSPVVFGAEIETLVPIHVQKGTNLIHIARKYCPSRSAWKTIARVNHLKSPYIIHAGSTLRIPASLLITENVAAKVASVSGSPRLMTGERTSRLQKGDLVLPGQTVSTGADEYVHLIYPDHKHTRIGPESEMTLVYLMRLTDNTLQAEFSLKKGKVIHSITKKLKINEHFETRTPVAITGVRGTEFRMKVINDETNIVETLNGQVAVAAAGKELILPKGKGSKVKKGQPPAPPRKLPARPDPLQIKEVYRLLPLVIPAPEHKTAKYLRLRVAKDEQGHETLLVLTTHPGSRFQIRAIADGHYYVFLTAIDSEDFESVPSKPAKLYVRTSPPAPSISKPNNGFTTFESKIKIRWLKSDQAAFYVTQIAEDQEFSTIIDEQQVKDATFTTNELPPGGYFFRVRLVTEDGFSTLYSEHISWKVMEQPKMGEMAPVAADDGSIHLRWAQFPDTERYMLQIATDKKFTNLIVNEKQLKDPSYTITDHLDAGNYSIRIRTILNDGQKSPWSQPQTMTIDPEPLGIEHFFITLCFIALIIL